MLVSREGERWEGMGGLVFLGDGVSVWEDEKVLEMMVVMGVQPCECTSCHSMST